MEQLIKDVIEAIDSFDKATDNDQKDCNINEKMPLLKSQEPNKSTEANQVQILKNLKLKAESLLAIVKQFLIEFIEEKNKQMIRPRKNGHMIL